MPTIKITANQVVYYEKTMELSQDEYDELMAIYEDEDSLLPNDVTQWLAEGDSGFEEEDIVEGLPVEDLEITTIA